jgi:hypothetical protein
LKEFVELIGRLKIISLKLVMWSKMVGDFDFRKLEICIVNLKRK